MSSLIARFDDVSYLYPRSKAPVLKHVSFQIEKGEFFGLVGPTGAGKSTLCLAFNGIVPQFYGGRFFGDAQVAGLDTVDHSIRELSHHVAAVFEDPETQLITTSVENEIAFALENQKVSVDEIFSRIPEVLQAVRLEGTEKKHPQELSGGQKQRLSIAAALAIQPDILILDEPTSQLDPVGAEEVFSVIQELNQELGITILMSSHASEEMAAFVDRMMLLSQGEVVDIGPPDRIYSEIELLRENYLRPPQVTETFYEIRKNKIHISSLPTTLDAGRQLLEETCKMVTPSCSLRIEEQSAKREDPLISVRHLSHTYPNGTQALEDISLDIHQGEYVLIIGQNGAGKSTLVRHFLKLLVPTRGDVVIGATNTRDLAMSDLASNIGYIAQNPDNQIFTANVKDEVAFALENLNFDKQVVEERTRQALADMGLLEYIDEHPLSLPKGDRARVVIAAILAMNPETIIFDEPTTGQDYKGAKYILDVSKQLHQQGKTVIVITHHLYLMPEYAERVLVMGKGSILLDAPIREAYHRVNVLKSTYLTPPQAVFLAKHLESIDSQRSYPLLTPSELAECFHRNSEGIDYE